MVFLLYPLWIYIEIMIMYTLYIAYITEAGYVPKEFAVPLDAQGLAPIKLLRVYNLRNWLANGIYNFDEICENDAQRNEVPKKTTP